MENIMNLIEPSVLIICLCVGYVWKHMTLVENKTHDYIPLSLMFLGIILTCWMKFSVDVGVIAQGAITGLASVGLHQAFTRTIEGLSSTHSIPEKNNNNSDKAEGE